MKTCYLIIILLLVLPVYGVRGGIAGRNVDSRQSSPVASWPEDCVVNVYFVQNMFTPGEKQILWRAIETWTQRARNKGLQISFIPAGETGGLIDCVGCLTIARQGLALRATRQRTSFNALRRDARGHLISAWVEFERAITTETELETLMFQALEGRLAPNGSQTAKGIRS